MKKILSSVRLFCYVIAEMLAFASCSESDSENVDIKRTVLVYIASDNDLDEYRDYNIQFMLQGMKNVEGRLLIYSDSKNAVPYLLMIEGAANPKLDTLIVYPEEENSASPKVLRRTIEDMRRLYPSDSYGLILWSHGMGWLPVDNNFTRSRSANFVKYTDLKTKWFGLDTHPGNGRRESVMEVNELAAGITGHFNFILFDACFMGSVELLYALRNNTDYFIASPAEILANGFPYDKIVPWLWGGVEELKKVCDGYFHYYNDYLDPANQGWNSATIALVKAAELHNLAKLAAEIVGDYREEAAPDVWRYPLSRSSLPDVFYDLGDYIDCCGSESQRAAFKSQLEKTVLFKAATPAFFNQPVPADKFSGLSVYIPQARWSSMNQFYYQLEWARTVYGR